MQTQNRTTHANAQTGQEPLFPSRKAFIVQFARAQKGDEAPYVGRVEHVVSGRSSRFATPEDLLAFMRDVLEQTTISQKTS